MGNRNRKILTNWKRLPKADWPLVRIEAHGQVFEVDPSVVFPYAHVVPTEHVENLKWRKACIELGRKKVEYAQQLWSICERDPLFWVNTFAWTYDPRKLDRGDKADQPWITMDFQVEHLVRILAAMGFLADKYPGLYAHDLAALKSRDMGWTWMVLLMFCWAFSFVDHPAFVLLSRKKELVDSPGDDHKTLFWKVRHVLECLPGFIQPMFDYKAFRLMNVERKGVIAGDASTSGVGAGDRATAVFFDELSRFAENEPNADYEAWRTNADTTKCRIGVSTLRGMGKFYDLVFDSTTPKARCHWSKHPEKRVGLYRVYSTGNSFAVELLDKEWHAAHPEYALEKILPGGQDEYEGLRSPWYDAEWVRRGRLAIEMLEDVDMVPVGVGSQFFPPTTITIARSRVSLPVWTGQVQQMVGPLFIREHYEHPAERWCQLDHLGRPPQGTVYVEGCDIGTGLGASDSTIVVCDKVTGEQVFSYVNNQVLAEDLAKIAVEVARFFSTRESECFLVWEATGPGMAFGKHVVDTYGYQYVYRFKSKVERHARRSNKPGWYHAGKDGKRILLTDLRRALNASEYVIRDPKAVQELTEYIHTAKGPEHSKERMNPDPAGNAANHGDRVMAHAVCNVALQEQVAPSPPERAINRESAEWRRLEGEREWDDAEPEERRSLMREMVASLS